MGSKEEFVPFNKFTKNPVPGDLIEFKRVDTVPYFAHWAMYSDERGYVFNIDAESKNDTQALISLRSLKEVAGSSGIRINNRQSAAKIKGLKPKTGAEAVTAARRDLGKKLPYSFTGCNCEYYATKWKYGEGFSGQVKGTRARGVYATCLTAGTGIGAAVGSVVPVAGTLTGALVGSIAGQVVGIGWIAYESFNSGP